MVNVLPVPGPSLAAARVPPWAVLASQPCPCGRPFRLVESIEGRTDDVLVLPAAGGGTVQVHPVVFHQVLDLLDAAGWQVRQHKQELLVLIAAPGTGFDATDLERLVQAAHP